jgi:2-polyprenyl-6-methoxyphenol hydroxylase-like FAD-dependent oxidoreductase
MERSLEGYTNERRPVARRWIELSERILRLAQATNPLTIAARNVALSIVARAPTLQAAAFERVAGLRE